MEFKVLFYIVSIIIYFIYSANKASRKRKELQEQKNSTPPKQSWEDELKEIIQKNLNPQVPQRETYREEESEFEEPWKAPAQVEILDTVPKKSERREYEEAKEYDWANYQGQELYSIETDKTPLAAHVAELEAAMEKKPEGPSVGLSILEEEGFNARKAFLFSEIFRAKYVEEHR